DRIRVQAAGGRAIRRLTPISIPAGRQLRRRCPADDRGSESSSNGLVAEVRPPPPRCTADKALQRPLCGPSLVLAPNGSQFLVRGSGNAAPHGPPTCCCARGHPAALLGVYLRGGSVLPHPRSRRGTSCRHLPAAYLVSASNPHLCRPGSGGRTHKLSG